jgi:hypothetical protein
MGVKIFVPVDSHQGSPFPVSGRQKSEGQKEESYRNSCYCSFHYLPPKQNPSQYDSGLYGESQFTGLRFRASNHEEEPMRISSCSDQYLTA